MVKRIEPYLLEALYAFTFDTAVILIFGAIVLKVSPFSLWPTIGPMILGAAIFLYGMELFFGDYKVAILAFLDRRRNDCFVSKELEIIDAKEEWSSSGRLGHCVITSFYNKDLDVGKWKIICVDQTQKKQKLRVAMPISIIGVLLDTLAQYKIGKLKMTYLKHSLILCRIGFPSD